MPGHYGSVAPQVEHLSESDCMRLLGTRQLGRVAFNVRGLPEILPVNYALEGSMVAFRTGPGLKLGFMPGARVAFEVDGWDPRTGIGWSVVVKGVAEDVTGDVGRPGSLRASLVLEPVAPGEKWNWIAIFPAEVSGRRFEFQPERRPLMRSRPR